MYLENLVNEIYTPIIGIETLLEIIDFEIRENAFPLRKQDKKEYYKILGVIEGNIYLVKHIKDIWQEYHNLIESLYKQKSKEP